MYNKSDTIKEHIFKIEKLKEQGKLHEASKLTEEYIVKYKDDYRFYEELADINIYLGNIKKAEKAINFALKLHPESATGTYLKGFILLSQDKIKQALKFLEKSNKLLGNNPEVLRNLGWAYVMDGKHDRGIVILKRALALAPGDRLITEDLAMALIGKGDITEGYKLLEKVKKLKNEEKI